MVENHQPARFHPPGQVHVRFPEPRTHYVSVEAVLPSAGERGVEIFMPVWTPGSYLVREYARNIEGISVSGIDGKPLRFRQIAQEPLAGGDRRRDRRSCLPIASIAAKCRCGRTGWKIPSRCSMARRLLSRWWDVWQARMRCGSNCRRDGRPAMTGLPRTDGLPALSRARLRHAGRFADSVRESGGLPV